ncbi:RF9 [Retroperitoneal fibromatosis-associated herpesvirus]|uniref:RF9 n=1 Tax=Retroperitoneal fibromatosis-associated herpesvirus TaxID=111469 RepID=U5NIG0_9GAMA|nr:RF9 [Retroperitoneal fibromatosis-associated herpesvirus]AGY30740.1 RF9 [Retroperitoneal fibromatosis-associated herpesvirus]
MAFPYFTRGMDPGNSEETLGIGTSMMGETAYPSAVQGDPGTDATQLDVSEIPVGGILSSEDLAKMPLSDWIVHHVNSGKYPGVMWDDDAHTRFRIPATPYTSPQFRYQFEGELGVVYLRERGLTTTSSPGTTKGRRRLLSALRRTRGLHEVGRGKDPRDGHQYVIFRVRRPEELNCSICAVVYGAQDDWEHMQRFIMDIYSDKTRSQVVSAGNPQTLAPWQLMHVRIFYGQRQVAEHLTEHPPGARISAPPSAPLACLMDHVCPRGSAGQIFFPKPEQSCCAVEHRAILRTLAASVKGLCFTASDRGICVVCHNDGQVFFRGNTLPADSTPIPLPLGKPVKIYDPDVYFMQLAMTPPHTTATSHLHLPYVTLYLLPVSLDEPTMGRPKKYPPNKPWAKAAITLQIMPRPLWQGFVDAGLEATTAIDSATSMSGCVPVSADCGASGVDARPSGGGVDQGEGSSDAFP